MTERRYTAAEVGQLLRVSVEQVEDLAASGELDAERSSDGGEWVVSGGALVVRLVDRVERLQDELDAARHSNNWALAAVFAVALVAQTIIVVWG